MMVNFHGCTLPRGWSRTYPNLMSMEAVRGAECYTFAKEYPDKAPWHNTILPFTRNVVGPMDYTPVAFTNGGNPRKTTAGHELALAVVFESGWLHFADRTSAYRELPAEPRKFLQAIPVAWDDTRLLGGYPGKWVAIARRKGDDWYVGVLNGQPAAHQVALELNFLAAGSYTLTAIFDGQQGLEHRTSQLMTKHMVQESLPPRGGIVLQIRKSQAPEN
jgi:hypothetical protein